MMESSDDETKTLIVQPGRTAVNAEYGTQSYDDVEDYEDANVKSLTIDEAVETAGFGKFHILMLIVMGWSNSADALQVLSISFVLPEASCDLRATEMDMGYLTAAGFAGMMLGSIFWCSIADIKGRIPSLVLCQICNGLFIVGSSLSQELWFLTVTRFFSGFGVGGTSPLIYVYVVELLPMKYRGKMMGVLSLFFNIGQVVIAGMAWLIIPRKDWSWTTGGFEFNSWRLFLLISSVPVLMSVPMLWACPESPRYLIQANQETKAKAAIKRIYLINNKGQTYNDNYRIARNANAVSRVGIRENLKKMGENIWNLVAIPKLRSIFIFSSLTLFSLSFSYFGFNMWFPTLFEKMDAENATSVCASTLIPVANKTVCDNSDQTQVYIDTFLQSVSAFPGHVVFMLLVDRLGRKLLTGASMVLTGVVIFFLWVVSTRTDSVILACVFSGVTTISWDTYSLLTAEIFPTELRSTANGVQIALFNRVAAITSSLVFGALISSHCVVVIILVAVLLTFGGLLTYKLPVVTKLE